MENNVSVTTRILSTDLESGTNYQVEIVVEPIEGTDHEWVDMISDKFVHHVDHKSYAEAVKTLYNVNEMFGLPEPPVPTASQLRGIFND